MEFIGYNGIRYLQAVNMPGHVALACPDCGAGHGVPMAQYFGPDPRRVERHCELCGQCVFPVVEHHQQQWADAHETWNTNGFGQQVRSLRRFGVPIGRLKEDPFLALHQVLADLDPLLAYACQWITHGDLLFALEDGEVRKRVGQSITPESAEAARELARKRLEAMKPEANLVTAATTRTAVTLFRDDATIMIAMFVMLSQMEALARDGDRHAAQVRGLATRCDMLRRLMSGKMDLPKGHTRIDFVSDEAGTLAKAVMSKVEDAVRVMNERLTRDQ